MKMSIISILIVVLHHRLMHKYLTKGSTLYAGHIVYEDHNMHETNIH